MWFCAAAALLGGSWDSFSYLDSVLCVGGFVDASFTDGEGAHADVFLQYVAVAEQQVLAV